MRGHVGGQRGRSGTRGGVNPMKGTGGGRSNGGFSLVGMKATGKLEMRGLNKWLACLFVCLR